MAETGRVLYLNLERYSALQNLEMIEETGGDMDDLIYYCRMDEDSLVYRIGSLVKTFRNLDYIPPAAWGEDVMHIAADEWLHICARLAGAGEYDVIILDMDIAMEAVVPLLLSSSAVYMPVLNDRVSEAKVAHFFKSAQQMGGGDLAGRVQKVNLPPVREELWGRDISARLARGKMGAYVRRLLHEEGGRRL